ncbi:DUF4919 domain-containing protein [Chryseobacterium sp. Mn2064]|uniref:DUF4919 domain-containing protein n=1 Tax=Chryseobacterium sp. Mn2064 TaxID=3395263 RepID=UPI003BC8BDC2
MTIKVFFSLFFFIGFTFLQAQKLKFKAPDYSLIEKNIQDKNSEFYYPKLLKRLQQNDTILTNDEYRHLYFGYIFQKSYSPYKISKKAEEMTKYYRGEGITEKDLPKGIQLFKEALEENPLDIRAMNYLAYMYHLTNDETTAKKIAENFRGLLEAILSSGDGLTCETGFHVISVTDEYVMMNRFQMEPISQSYKGQCDYQKFEKDKYTVPGLYFNVSKFYGKIVD